MGKASLAAASCVGVLMALAVCALAGMAQASPLTACSMVSAAEYKTVLGHAV